jgi:hypothetical protein
MTLSIRETRSLVLSTETLVDALLELDRGLGGNAWRSTVSAPTLEDGAEVKLVLTARAPGAATDERLEFGAARIVAAIVNYCRLNKVPLPKKSAKAVKIADDGVILVLECHVEPRRIHAPPQPGQRPARVATMAPAPPQRDPASAPAPAVGDAAEPAVAPAAA